MVNNGNVYPEKRWTTEMYKRIFLSFKVDNDSQLINWSSTAKRVEKDGQSKFQLSNHSEKKKKKTKQKGMPQLDQVV